MNRAFTIVELVVVITIIALLATMTTVLYSAYRDKAHTAELRTTANRVRNGAERYYQQNNGYPLAYAGLSNNNSCAGPSDYSTVRSVFNMEPDEVFSNTSRIVPHTGSDCGTENTDYVYYLTKVSSDTGATTRSYTFSDSTGSCTYTLLSSVDPNDPQYSPGGAYLLAYYDYEKDIWSVTRSNNGRVDVSSGCSWKPL